MELDHSDCRALESLADKNIEAAKIYYQLRKECGSHKSFLYSKLKDAYKSGTIEKKHKEEKAFVMLAEQDDMCEAEFKNLVEKEDAYKGLEKVIDSRQARISLGQTIAKITPK